MTRRALWALAAFVCALAIGYLIGTALGHRAGTH